MKSSLEKETSSNKILRNKVALITGASRGIGKAIALEFASMGADIALNYVRNEEAAAETLKLLRAKDVKASSYLANVGDPKAMEIMVDQVIAEFGKIDILVHNAALGAFKPVHKLKMNQYELSMDVNTKALLLLTQRVLPSMEKNGGGSIITLSSLGSHRFIPNYGGIGISKAALETLVKYLAVELAPKNVRVNCVSGGLVDTDAVKFFPNYEDLKKEVISKTPAGRIGCVEDISKVVAFLASPDSRWIVGQTIVADGGLSLI